MHDDPVPVKQAVAEPSRSLPPAAGISLKPEHYKNVLGEAGDGGLPAWVEVHPQNYFGLGEDIGGGPPHRWLAAIADRFPVSFHSVGLSLGNADGCDAGELERLCQLADRFRPASVSDHLSWCGNAHEKYADLLPVPYTYAALDHFAREIGRVQDRLRCAILIENPSRYLSFAADEMDECEFLAQLCRRAGCGLLLDVNNIVVSAANLGHLNEARGGDAAGGDTLGDDTKTGEPIAGDAETYIDTIDPRLVGEIHLAGHAREDHGSGPLLIDDHGSRVGERTWELYRRFIARSGDRPTLVEWDSDIPDYAILIGECSKAQHIMDTVFPAVGNGQ